jgi:hypothetical protein
MIRNYLPVVLAFFFALSVKAQNTAFNEGDKVLNLGLGLGSTLYTGSFYSTSVPPISGSFEIGIKDELFDENSSLGVGGYLGYSSSKYSGWGGSYGFSNFIFGGRGSLHYHFIDNLDTYAGLMLGFRVVNWKSSSGNFNYGSIAGSGLATAFYVGGRYYFTDNLAGMVELGYGIAYLNIGIALKF